MQIYLLRRQIYSCSTHTADDAKAPNAVCIFAAKIFDKLPFDKR